MSQKCRADIFHSQIETDQTALIPLRFCGCYFF
ncbi:hypothetical protein LTSESEN_4993, partial [Salmonella enterica subsp. enterica serovar Senftenberg str. A4-543]